jgi:hypothetical protein
MSSSRIPAEAAAAHRYDIAVLVPRYNEARAIGEVIGDFGSFGIALALVAIGLAVPIFLTYLQQGLVPRLPTALLSTGLMLLAFLSIACGLILDTVTRGRRQAKLIAYLALRAPGEERRRS